MSFPKRFSKPHYLIKADLPTSRFKSDLIFGEKKIVQLLIIEKKKLKKENHKKIKKNHFKK